MMDIGEEGSSKEGDRIMSEDLWRASIERVLLEGVSTNLQDCVWAVDYLSGCLHVSQEACHFVWQHCQAPKGSVCVFFYMFVCCVFHNLGCNLCCKLDSLPI